MQRDTTQNRGTQQPIKKGDISIIIPVHNEERYLPYSLKPLIDLKDIRIIFVLDKCTDRSDAIVMKFAKKHGNTMIKKKEERGKMDNPAWEVYLEGVKYVRHACADYADHGRVIFLGSDVIIDKRIFNYLDKGMLLKFRYINYGSHLGYAFDKVFQRFFSKSYCVECIDTELVNAIPFPSESYEDIVRGRTKLSDILDADLFNRKFVFIDAVECLHLRPRVPVDRQFLQGYIRHMKGVPFLRVLFHSLVYRKIHVLRGYIFRMLRKSERHG